MARIIEGDIYKARLLAKEILEAGEKQCASKMRDAQDLATQIEQEAALLGTQEAHAEIVEESIAIFSKRHRLVLEAETHLRKLSAEIAKKILGESPKLSDDQHKKIISSALLELGQKRRLCIQFGQGRLSTLDISFDRGIDLEEVCDVEPGKVRVMTDVGAIVCTEDIVVASLQKNHHDS